MAAKNVRGSSKMAAMSVEDLHKAVGSARSYYKVTRWIIKGIPPVYDIEALLDVKEKERVGELIQSLIRLQIPGREVGIVVFPYGIPVIDGVTVQLGINVSGPGAV